MANREYEKTEPKIVKQVTFEDFDKLFPDEQSCWVYLLLHRWPSGPHCPRCDNDHVYESTARPWHWQCKKCGKDNRSPYRFSLKTGTIFEETKMPLRTWFKVLHLMLTSKKGMSALQIHRMLGTGSYRSAWYMCHRLRAGLRDENFRKLMGVVEVDETYIGGKDRNRHRDKKSRQQRAAAGPQPFGAKIGFDKVGVIAAIERKGNVVARVISAADARTLHGSVRNVTADKVLLTRTSPTNI